MCKSVITRTWVLYDYAYLMVQTWFMLLHRGTLIVKDKGVVCERKQQTLWSQAVLCSCLHIFVKRHRTWQTKITSEKKIKRFTNTSLSFLGVKNNLVTFNCDCLLLDSVFDNSRFSYPPLITCFWTQLPTLTVDPL